MPDPIGNINNLITRKASAPRDPKPPSRIEVVEKRVDTLESALQTVFKELTALRETVERQRRPKETATPKETGKHQASSPSEETQPREKTKVSKPKQKLPWDAPDIRKDIEAVRPKILELLSDGNEITKQGCADALNLDASLAGRTLSYMMTVKKEIEMISPPPTEDDPDPKKIFRRKQK